MSYELTGKIANFSIDYKTKKATVTLELNEKKTAMMMYDNLNLVDKLAIKIDKHREKRSLDANAYCFVLIDKLASELNLSKEEVYRNAIKEIGGVSEIICVKNDTVEKICKAWSKKGLGWQVETFPSKIEGCTNVILYFGSSSFDTAQMQRLISNIQQDCEAVGIDTKTPNQIAEMMSLWESENG